MNIGDMICKAGAGPQPIPQKLLNADNLAEAIKFTQTPAAQAAAQQMGSQIRSEVNNKLYIYIISFEINLHFRDRTAQKRESPHSIDTYLYRI